MRRMRRSWQKRETPKRTKIWEGGQQEPGSTSAIGECGFAKVNRMVLHSKTATNDYFSNQLIWQSFF